MIKLEHGDCLKLMPKLPERSIDLILADLPYGKTNTAWDKQIPLKPLWKQYRRIIKSHGAILLFGSEPFASHVRLANERWYRYDWIWVKTMPTLFQWSHHRPMNKNELIMVFYRHLPKYHPQMSYGYSTYLAEPRKFGRHKVSKAFFSNHEFNHKARRNDNGSRFPTTVIKFSNQNKHRLHPTQKPLPLLRYLILTYTDRGDTVLDNCMGSGSTGVACKELRRNFIGMEINNHYYRVAEKRIHNT